MHIDPAPTVNLYGESHGPEVKRRVSNPVQTCQIKLAQLLRTPRHPCVNVICGTEFDAKRPAETGFHTEDTVEAHDILARMRTGIAFVYKVHISGSRIKWVREVRHRTHEIAGWSHCYRTAESPVLQPSPEWLRNMNRNNSFDTGSMIWGTNHKA